jgi:hypothetical protein
VVKSVLQHFIAGLPPLDPTPIPARYFSWDIQKIANHHWEDPRDPTQMQQSCLFFIPVIAQAHNNLPFLVDFISRIHEMTSQMYWTDPELLQPFLRDALLPAVWQMKFPSQFAHRIYTRLTNGGDYTANVLELERLMKCLWKAKLHDVVAMVAEKMCEPQFEELEVARFEKYMRKTSWEEAL